MHRLLISIELFKIRSIKVYIILLEMFLLRNGVNLFHADSSAQVCVKPDDCVLQQDLRMIRHKFAYLT